MIFRTASCSNGTPSTVPDSNRVDAYADGIKFGEFVLDTDLGHVDEVVRHDPRIPNPGDADNEKVLGVVAGSYALVDDQTEANPVTLYSGSTRLTENLDTLRFTTAITCTAEQSDPDDVFCGSTDDSGAFDSVTGTATDSLFRLTFDTLSGGQQGLDIPGATFNSAGVVRGVSTLEIDGDSGADFLAWSVDRIRRAVHRIIPDPDAGDAGQVLGVDASGDYELVTQTGGGVGSADGVVDEFTASHQGGELYFTVGRTEGLADIENSVVLPTATSTDAGIVEFATNAEATGGQLSTRAITPANLAGVFGLFVSNNALNRASPLSEPTGIAASRRAVADAVSDARVEVRVDGAGGLNNAETINFTGGGFTFSGSGNTATIDIPAGGFAVADVAEPAAELADNDRLVIGNVSDANNRNEYITAAELLPTVSEGTAVRTANARVLTFDDGHFAVTGGGATAVIALQSPPPPGPETLYDTLDDTGTGVSITGGTWNDADSVFDIGRAITAADDGRNVEIIASFDVVTNNGSAIVGGQGHFLSWIFPAEAFRRLPSRELTQSNVAGSLVTYVRRGATMPTGIATYIESALHAGRVRASSGNDELILAIGQRAGNPDNTNYVDFKLQVTLQ